MLLRLLPFTSCCCIVSSCLTLLAFSTPGMLAMPTPHLNVGATAVLQELEADPAAGEYGEYYQGDIMDHIPGAFAGLIDKSSHWPSGEVLYEFDQSLPAAIRANALLAMSRVTQETGGCARFREWTPLLGVGHVLIRNGNGCSASLGYDANRVTSMRLSMQCSIGSIMHEFQHTLGVEHQQNRPDRDEYVKVLTDNIRQGSELDFMKESSRYYDTYGQPYDFGSQMHYGLLAFSKNGLPTMEALPGRLPAGVTVGQRDRMSEQDVALVRAMYKCSAV